MSELPAGSSIFCYKTTNDARIQQLLDQLLSVRRGSPLIALRNAEDLPAKLSGRDLDVAVVPGWGLAEAYDHVIARAQGLGWRPVCASLRDHMAALTLLHLGEPPLAIHFDIFREVAYLSIPIIGREELLAESLVANDVRRLSRRAEVAATVIHRVLFGGILNKQKYVDQLGELLSDADDAAWLHSRLALALGPEIAQELTNVQGLMGLRTDGERRSRLATRTVLRTNLLRRPFATVASVGRYFLGQLGSVRRPPGVVGRPGDLFAQLPGHRLSLHLACAISIYGLYQPSVRSSERTLETENESRYAEGLKRRWRKWAPLRWLLPSVFLWLHAKRAGIVLVDRLPWVLRLARHLDVTPRWVAKPAPRGEPR